MRYEFVESYSSLPSDQSKSLSLASASVSELACPPAQVCNGAPCWSPPKHLCRQQSRRSVSKSVSWVGRVMDGFVEENCRWHPRTTAPRLAARFSAFAALDEGGERPAGSRGRLTVAQWLATVREGGREDQIGISASRDGQTLLPHLEK